VAAAGLSRRGSSFSAYIIKCVRLFMRKFYPLGLLREANVTACECFGTVQRLTATPAAPWVGKIPWRREWLLTPVFLPGEFYEQRRLAGYSTRSRKELDTTEQLTFSLLSQLMSSSE